MSFLQLVLSLDKTIRDLILFCRQCHSDPYRNSLSLCPCYVCVIVINQNCQKQGKLCKLFLHMASTEFAHAQLRVNRVCTCSVKGKHDTKP